MKQRMTAELERWEHGLENRHPEPPFIHAMADFDASKQMINPLKVLTSEGERKGSTPFYSSGKWRWITIRPQFFALLNRQAEMAAGPTPKLQNLLPDTSAYTKKALDPPLPFERSSFVHCSR